MTGTASSGHIRATEDTDVGSREFSNCHPAVILVFYIFVIWIAVTANRPEFVIAALICSFGYSAYLGGIKTVKTNLVFFAVILVVMAVINTLFTHNGETVLFYLNENRITAEAFWYGVVAACMLSTVIFWFSSFNILMTSEKIVYLFGRTAPVLGLTMSMIFRFIPLMKTRYREIEAGQKCLGRNTKSIRQILKQVSILTAWSLEASIETADSMEARGYGLSGRTAFHLFRFRRSDLIAVLVIAVFGIATVGAGVMDLTKMYYYPRIVYGPMDLTTALVLTAYIVLMLVPLAMDVKGDIVWKRSDLRA